ncbi:DUF305 domain-containing protein, partial [Klebsiella pneumoniae]|nr:DUF305 domain-containing protein [Klebsiella pneumoniae]
MRKSTIIGAVLAGGLALAGCTPSEEPSDQPPAPGTPPPATAQPQREQGQAQDGQHTSTDVEFANQLLSNNEQLLQLADLANRNAESPQLKSLASQLQQKTQGQVRQLE